MISVIVPTMWRPPHIKKMLPMLDRHPLIGEIILIDNDSTKTDHEFLKRLSKLVYYSFKEGNIFVNPAWNFGVKNSKYDKLLILNDDCVFNLYGLQKIYDFITPENGIIGFSFDSYCNYDLDAFDVLRNERYGNNIIFDIIDPKDYKFMTGMPHIHYGSLMFMHKKNYYPIPNELKVFFGDLFIYISNLKNNIGNYEIKNGLVMSRPSSTVSELTKKTINDESKLVRDIFAQFGIDKLTYNVKRSI